MIRVLVVDDSSLMRRMIASMLNDQIDMQVIEFAQDGEEAVRKALELKPDVITMDVEMPKMGGLLALRMILDVVAIPVVMVSSLTTEGAATTLEALEIGAVDFICKPDGGAIGSLRRCEHELVEKVRNAAKARVHTVAFHPVRSTFPTGQTDRIVLIASSTGGPRALTALFTGLDHGILAPILIVQHMPPGFTAGLARRLDAIGTVPCREAQPGDRAIPGQALMAPAGTHMKVRSDYRLEFNLEPVLHGVRPAADHLFRTAAEAFGSRCVVAILTGMGRDGAEGARAVRAAGGTVLAEAESTCAIHGMPKAAVLVGAVHQEVPIHRMGEAINDAVAPRRRLARAS